MDHLGCLGIVLSQSVCPDQAWIALQRDRRFAERAGDRWWKVASLTGGGLLLPESLIRVVGPPAAQDVDNAMQNANEFGKQLIRQAIGLCRDE
jgi:hypothetical protein